MNVSRRTRRVTAAMNASDTNGSKEWWPPPSIHALDGKGWSVVETMSNPLSSAATATSARSRSPIHRSQCFTARVGNW